VKAAQGGIWEFVAVKMRIIEGQALLVVLNFALPVPCAFFISFLISHADYD